MVSANIDDAAIEEFLDAQENKSETVREALRLYRLQNEAIEDDRLTGAQRAAYRWLREQAGVGGTLRLEVARTVLAQTLSRDKALIKHTVLQPLDRLEYIDVTPSVEVVRIRVLAPPADADESNNQVEVDSLEDAEDRLNALAEAGEEAAEP